MIAVAAAAVAAVLATAGAAPAPAATPTPTTTPGVAGSPDVFRIPAGRLRVHAEHLSVSHGRVVEATGGVDVEAPGIHANADRIVYDAATNMMEVSGGVHLELDADGEHASMTAGSASVDLKTRAGVLRDATLTGAGMTLKGARIVRTESGRYRIDQAEFTPCQCADGKPSWEITASRVSAKPDGVGILQGGVLRAKGIPIFFLPIGFAPASAERASGFLSPQFAQTGNDGVIVSLPFYLAIARSWDLTVDPGYNQERGPFAGGTLRLSNSAGGGELDAVYHSDRRVKNDAVTFPGRPELYSPDRWYTNDRLTERLSGSDVAKVRVEVASDDRYGFDFGPTLLERSRPDYESNVAIEHRGDILGAVASGNYFQDLRVIGSAGPYNSAQTVSRLGGLDLSAGG
ncbi:MAG TPA: hypothetical protein VMV18_04265, partial [bacterium]|nr:hypothetical protein [bacterium]